MHIDVLQEIWITPTWVSMYLCGQQLLCLEPLVFLQLQMRLPRVDASQLPKHECACCKAAATLPRQEVGWIWDLRWQLVEYFCPLQETFEEQSCRKSQLFRDDFERFSHQGNGFAHVVTRWHEALEDDFRSAAWPRPSLMAARLLRALLLNEQCQSLGAQTKQAEDKPAQATALSSSHATAAVVSQLQSLGAAVYQAEDQLANATALDSNYATAAALPRLVAKHPAAASSLDLFGMARGCPTGHASDALSAHCNRHLQAVLQSIVTPSQTSAASSADGAAAADAASCPAVAVELLLWSFALALSPSSQLSMEEMRGVLQCIIMQRLSSAVDGATAAVPATSRAAVSAEADISTGPPSTSQASLKVLKAMLQLSLMQGQPSAASSVDTAAAAPNASSQGARFTQPSTSTPVESRSQLSMADLRAICKLAELNSSTGLISSASQAVRSKVILPCGLSLGQLADIDPDTIDALSMKMHEDEYGPCSAKPLVKKDPPCIRLDGSGSSPDLSSSRQVCAVNLNGKLAAGDPSPQGGQVTTEPAASQSTGPGAECVVVVSMSESPEELLSLVTLSSLLASAHEAGHLGETSGSPQLHLKHIQVPGAAHQPNGTCMIPIGSAASAAAAAISPSGSAASSNVPQSLDCQERHHRTDSSAGECADLKRQQPVHPIYNLVSKCRDMPEYVCRQFSIAALVSTLQGMPIRSASSSKIGISIWSFQAAGPAYQLRGSLEQDYETYRRLCDDACHPPVPLGLMADSIPASEQTPASSSRSATPAACRRLDQGGDGNEEVSKQSHRLISHQLEQQQQQQLQQQLPATSHEPSAALQAAKDKRSRKQAKSGRKQAASLQNKPDAAAGGRAEQAAETAAMMLLLEEELGQRAHLEKAKKAEAKKAEAKRSKLQKKKAKAEKAGHLAAVQTPAGPSPLSLNRDFHLHDLTKIESLLCW